MILTNLFLLLLTATQVNALGPQPPKVRPSAIPTYDPRGTNLNGTDFSKWVVAIVATGSKVVALAQGRYDVQYPDAYYASYITFTALYGVTVWMDKVTLVFPDNTVTGFSIDRCSYLTTYGPTMYYSVPGFSQATITQSSYVSGSTYQFQFQCDAGYDCSSMVQSGNLNAEYIDPNTGLLQPGPGYSVFVGPATMINSNTWQYTYYGAYFAPLPGHKLLSRGQFLYCNKIQASNYTSINDFTTLNCGGINWLSYLNVKPYFNSIVVKPATFPPPGGTALPMRSSNGDGIHSNSDLVGPQVDSCLFSLLNDDCIAIQGEIGFTYSSSGNTFVGSGGVSNGDVLKFYYPDTYKSLGSAKVLSSSQTSNGNTQITVSALPTGFSAGNTIFVNQNQQGSGFSITNTHTTGNRGRGAIVKGSNGLIANNVFEKVSYAGIYLGPEFKQWNETDWVRNIKVQSNQILDCGYIDGGVSAFSLHGDTAVVGSQNTTLNPIDGNSNITIIDLLISGTGTQSNIYLGATTNVSVSGVVIQNALSATYPIDETTPTALANFQNVKFLGPVGICQRNTGNSPTPGGVVVYDVHYYGTVIGGITGIPQC